VIIDVEFERQPKLARVAYAARAMSAVLRLAERAQQQPGQNRQDIHDD
jgi:hypothetical protein